jgi:hypothetical protein
MNRRMKISTIGEPPVERKQTSTPTSAVQIL